MSVLTPPSLWSDEHHHEPAPPSPPPPPDPPRETRERRPRRRPPLAALLITCSLLGGGTTAAALAATGNLGSSTTTTTTKTVVASSSGDGSSLNPAALYAATSAGVVDITVNGGSGTGFEVDTAGHIVTAAHVVDNATSITVKLADGTSRKATLLGKDDATDIAVLKIDPTGLKLSPLKLGDSSSIDVGASVAAIGDPFGYDRSLSTGIISGVDRTIQAPNGFTVAHALQTDAAINPGNSGGPVLDASGSVIGIADQIATGGSGADQSSGVGFAVPIDLVKSELTALEAGQTVEHAYLGVSSSETTGGVSVAAVTGPAASGGLRSGDVITKLGDTAISDQNDLVAAIAAHKPGDQVKVTVKRSGSSQTLTVTLGTQPAKTG